MSIIYIHYAWAIIARHSDGQNGSCWHALHSGKLWVPSSALRVVLIKDEATRLTYLFDPGGGPRSWTLEDSTKIIHVMAEDAEAPARSAKTISTGVDSNTREILKSRSSQSKFSLLIHQRLWGGGRRNGRLQTEPNVKGAPPFLIPVLVHDGQVSERIRSNRQKDHVFH
jgi:hypothetical protein